jgi:uncharacterized OB-fold protein
MADEYRLLLPDDQDVETAPYWQAAREHTLALQRCSDCQTFRHPPQKICSTCFSEESAWVPVSGKGTVNTYIVIHQPVIAAYKELAPYDVIRVTPDEAPNLEVTGNLADPAQRPLLSVGKPVEVVFDDVTPTDTLPRWRII